MSTLSGLLVFLCALVCLTSASLSQSKVVYNVKDYGVVGDGKTLDTRAIQKVLDMTKDVGPSGATVYFPDGQYLTGAINLTSNLILQISSGATILAIPDPAYYPILPPFPSYGYSRDTGTVDRYSPFIGGYNLTNVIITGGGTINGQGDYWWNLFNNKKLLHGRPRLVEFQHSKHLEIYNIHLLNSPFWTVHPIYCDDVYIHDITINNPAKVPNTDGIDPDSTTNVVVDNVYISCGDDMIAVKSGMRTDRTTVFLPSRNVTVKNSRFGTGWGLSVGSETSGGIYDVYFYNNTIDGAHRGAHLKTSRGRGGIIQNINYLDITLTNIIEDAIYVGMNYDAIPTPGNSTTTPILRDVVYIGVSGSADRPGNMNCLPESPCTGFIMDNVTIASKSSHFQCTYIHGIAIDVHPASCLASP